MELASCLIYARALLEYVNFILWLRSVTNNNNNNNNHDNVRCYRPWNSRKIRCSLSLFSVKR